MAAWRGRAGAHRWQNRKQSSSRPRGAGTGAAGPGLGKASWKQWVGRRPEEGIRARGSQLRRRLTEETGSPLIFKGNVSGVGGGGLVGLGGCSHFEFG